jgi:predicted ATPase
MLNIPQKFSNTKLDTNLLSTPYQRQTNWHVITGSSCSGKTTLIHLLAANGFQTVPETARLYFEEEIAKGHSIDEIRKDRTALTYQISDMQLNVERELNEADNLFLDRGLPDCFVFFRIAALNPNELLPKCLIYRYASVFMLDRLPYQKDGVRHADDATADYYDKWIERDYRALGYSVVRVPVIPPEDRLAFVLGKLSEPKLP